MATTYLQLSQKIKALQAQAEQIKKKEVAGVVARIKEAIAAYDLTAEELGLSGSTAVKGAAPSKRALKGRRGMKAAAKRASVAYQNGSGNTWGGRGPRPAWLREALANGADLASFLATAATPQAGEPSAEGGADANPEATPKTRKARKAAKAAKAAPSVKYKDDAGNTWSGLGPRPGWFKDALAAGKSPEDLAAG